MFIRLCAFVLFYATCFLSISYCVDIECIPVKSCPLAMKLIKTRTYAPETISYLKTSHCGYDEKKEPLVWCSKFSLCKTPLNENGTCQNVKSCPHVLELMQTSDVSIPTVKEFIQKYRCNANYEKDIHVCCPYGTIKMTDRFADNWKEDDEEIKYHNHDHKNYFHHYHKQYEHEHKSYETTPYPYGNSGIGRSWENRPFKKGVSGSFSGTWKNKIADTIENREDIDTFLECETPEKTKGVCKRVKECKPFQDLIRRGTLDIRNETTKQYLRNFRCPNSGNDINVCCIEYETTNNNKRIFNNIRYKNPTNCGRAISDNKIFGLEHCSQIACGLLGGRTTDLGEYPWLALFQYRQGRNLKYGCGGTLIDDRHILTAAHCLDRQILKQKNLGTLYRIILGEHDIRNQTDCIYTKYGTDCADTPQYFGTKSFVMHPSYNSTTATHDIAIVTLDRKVYDSDYIKPICLPLDAGFSLKGNESFYIAGWGKTETEKMSPVKLKARIGSAKKSDCTYSRYISLFDGQICAGRGNGTDSCYGDSGGPLMLEINDGTAYTTNAVGIISYGIKDCGNGPGVFTYIPHYRDWIIQNVANSK